MDRRSKQFAQEAREQARVSPLREQKGPEVADYYLALFMAIIIALSVISTIQERHECDKTQWQTESHS